MEELKFELLMDMPIFSGLPSLSECGQVLHFVLARWCFIIMTCRAITYDISNRKLGDKCIVQRGVELMAAEGVKSSSFTAVSVRQDVEVSLSLLRSFPRRCCHLDMPRGRPSASRCPLRYL